RRLRRIRRRRPAAGRASGAPRARGRPGVCLIGIRVLGPSALAPALKGPAFLRTELTMMTITADQVKKLRDQTGAGMMECKPALTEANGDLENATTILRKRGLA